MESTHHHYYNWEVSSDSSDEIPNNSNPNFYTDTFNIYVEFRYVVESLSSPVPIPVTETTRLSRSLPRRLVSSCDAIMLYAVESLLSSTGAERAVIDHIKAALPSFASRILNLPCNRNARVLNMYMSIDFVTCYHRIGEEDTDRAIRESMQENIVGFRAASKCWIEGLKRVRVEEELESGMEDCVICLEKQSVGEEVIGLPCKHMFHGDCILRWLQTSQICPLCRFSMS